jgi:hypothetical protein
MNEKFEDTKGLIRSRKSKKDRQHNDQKKKDRQHNDLEKIKFGRGNRKPPTRPNHSLTNLIT